MRASSLVAVLALAGCLPESYVPPAESPEPGDTTSAAIGEDGGTLSLAGFHLDVPPGALLANVTLSVTVSAADVPPVFNAFSPRYDFGPDGTQFNQPVTVALPFDGDPASATIFWTTAGGAYAAVPTRVEGNIAYAEVTHFSSGFVGSACGDGDCCGRANGDLDVLLMVDTSNSMTEEQALLAAQIPRIAEVLATGDLDGDGVQDFPALNSARIGTVSSDMGAGGYAVPTCGREHGDDGILATDAATAPECAASYPNYASLSSDDPLADPDAFVQQVSCVAQQGVGGCGFEQPLEALLKALTPSTAGPIFMGGTTGHGDGANAGFLREGSVLATILLTDEDDCSTDDARLFDPSEAALFTGDLNLRCYNHPEVQHPAARYVDGLRALRADPDDVIFALIAGVPVDLGGSAPAAILADPRMANVIDVENPNALTPSCNTGIGIAFPPRRLVETAQGFGANGVVTSICQDDFTPVINAILTRVAARVSGSCGAP